MSTVFAERTMSGFPLSIGTSIALEALFDPRQTPYDVDKKIEKVDVTQYQSIWINVATLMRNLMSSVAADKASQITQHGVVDTILTEMEVIQSIFDLEGSSLCKPIFYLNDYKSLYTPKFKNVYMRKDNTDAQKAYAKHFDFLAAFLLKSTDQVVHTDGLIKPTKESGSNSMLLSHSAFDLCSAKNFSTLHLLESHSGVLKKPSQWNTKLFQMGKSDMTILPFSSKMLFIFGDRYLIMPQLIGVRRVVYDIALNRNWSGATTKEKVDYYLETDVREPMVLAQLKSLPYV